MGGMWPGPGGFRWAGAVGPLGLPPPTALRGGADGALDQGASAEGTGSAGGAVFDRAALPGA
eukprot:4261193-Lingulodinium_polyedra.AAC.1